MNDLSCALLLAAALLLAMADAVGATATNDGPRLIAHGAFSGVQEAKQLIVTNRADWDALWKQHAVRQQPTPAAPEVDFKKEVLLFVTLGRKNTGGYGVSIPTLAVKEGKTVARVGVKSPPPDSMVMQALTAPFCILAVPITNAPAAFELFDEPPAKPRPRPIRPVLTNPAPKPPAPVEKPSP